MPATPHILNRVPRRSRRPRGFTLIEVLAALLLIGIVLPVVMDAVSVATSAAHTSRRRAEAGTLAESKLSELVATGDWQLGASSGDFSPDWPEYQWQSNLQDWYETGVEQLDVTVTWGNNGPNESLTLSTLVYLSGTNSPTSTGSTGTTGTTGGTGTTGAATGGTR